MKLIVLNILLAACFSLQTFALSDKVVLKLVNEDIYQYDGRLLGVSYVDKLTLNSCEEDKCSLSFEYDVSGCHWDDCFDLFCSGELSFDLETIETSIVKQECVDL